MAFTNDEAVEVFRFLVAALREHGLGWVVTQVEEKIAVGKVQAKKLRARDITESIDGLWEDERPAPPASNRAALFAVAEQYTPQERLNVLLDSIALAVPIVEQVADQTFVNLGELGNLDRLVFEPEAEVSDSFSLERKDLESRAQANEDLLRLIDELRRGELIADSGEPAR